MVTGTCLSSWRHQRGQGQWEPLAGRGGPRWVQSPREMRGGVGVELRPAEGGTGGAEGAHGVGPSAAPAGLGPVLLLWDVILGMTRLPCAHDGVTIPAHGQKPPPALRSLSLPKPR